MEKRFDTKLSPIKSMHTTSPFISEQSLWTNGNWYLTFGTISMLGLMGLLNAFFPFLAVSRFKLNNYINCFSTSLDQHEPLVE